MSTTPIPAFLRRLVLERAAHTCEYCLLAEEDMFFAGHIDHIISEKHGGQTASENLAYACLFCNLYKGSDIASLTSENQLVRLFNPRSDKWLDHFSLATVFIQSVTAIGEVTVRLLQLNHPDRILEREALLAVNRYPGPAASKLLR